MTISKARAARISGEPNPEEKRSVPFKDTIRKRPIMKESQKKKYLFPDFNLPRMLDDLKKGVIQLPKPKRPEQVGRIADPKYGCYHRMVSQPLEKCVTLKERIK